MSCVLNMFLVGILALIPALINSQKLPTAQENLDRMLKLRDHHGYVIKANSENFKKYMKSKHSKYSVVVMFTALGAKTKCEVCPDAKNQFYILASSYLSAPDSTTSPIFFAMVDYMDAPEAFQIMKLNHVPVVYYFPANRKRLKSDTYNGRSGYGAMALARWMSEVNGVKINVVVPFDYSKLLMPTLIVLLVGFITFLRPDLTLRVLGNRILWGISLMVIVLIMTSGQMWNYIRKPAEAGRDGNRIRYILGGRGGQYVLESYIVMAVNMAVAVGFILLNEVPSVKSGITKKVIGVIGLSMVVIFFGLLVSIFRIKSRGYPYSFIFQ